MGSEWTPRRLLVALAFVGGLALVFGALFADLLLGTGDAGLGTTQQLGVFSGSVLALGALVFASSSARKRALAALLGVGLTLVALELVLQFGFAPRYAPLRRDDPELLFTHLENARRDVARAGGGFVRVELDGEGFRGRPLEAEKSRPRLMVCGDSFLVAEFSELEATFCARLGAMLEAEHLRSFEVVNAGVAAYGPDQSFLRLQDKWDAVRPDFVLFAIYAGNDYGDLVRNQLFTLQKGQLRSQQPRLSEPLRREFERSRGRLLLPRAASRFWSELHATTDAAHPTGPVC